MAERNHSKIGHESEIIGEETNLMIFTNNTTLTHLTTKIKPHSDKSKHLWHFTIKI